MKKHDVAGNMLAKARTMRARGAALLAQAEALESEAIEVMLGGAVPEQPNTAASSAPCSHPVEARRDISTMSPDGSGKKWVCALCGEIVRVGAATAPTAGQADEGEGA
jgi:hypothetical protein